MPDAIASAFVELGLRDVGLRRGMADARREVTGFQQALSATVPGVGALQRAMQFGLAGGALVAGVRLGELAYEMAEAGAQSERLRTAFDGLWSSAGQTGEEALLRLRAASRGTVSDMDLMLAANRASMLGVASSTEQLAELMEIAAFRGRAMGLSMSQAFDNIVTGVGRASPLILDNLGITVDLEAANAAYARSIGTTAEALDEAQRKQALLNAVLQTGRAELNAAGGVALDTADNFARLEVSWGRLMDALQRGAAGLLGGPIGALADYFDVLDTDTADLAKMSSTYDEFYNNWIAHLTKTANAYYLLRDAAQVAFGDLGTAFIDRMFPGGAAALKMPVPDIGEWVRLKGIVELTADQMDAFYYGATTGLAATERAARLAAAGVSDITDAMVELNAVTRVTLDQLGTQLAQEYSFAVGQITGAIAEGYLTVEQGRAWAEAFMNGAKAQLQGASARGAPGLDLFDVELQKARDREQLTDRLDALRPQVQRAAAAMRDEMTPIIEGVFRSTFTGDPTGTLDALGFHIDTADEGARRLASVMAEGLSSEWATHFANTGLLKPDDLVSDDTVRAAAARLLRLQQFGPVEGLFDREAAIQQVEAIVAGKARMAALVADVMADPRISGLGLGRADVSAALGDPAAQAVQVAQEVATQVAGIGPVAVQASVNLSPLTAEQINTWMAEAEGIQFDATPILNAPSDIAKLYFRTLNATGIQFDAQPVLGQPSAEELERWRTEMVGISFRPQPDMTGFIAELATAIDIDAAMNGENTLGLSATSIGNIIAQRITGEFYTVPYMSPLAEAITTDFAANSTKLLGISEAIGSYIATVINARVKSEVNIIQGVVDAAIEQMAEGLIEQAEEGGQ